MKTDTINRLNQLKERLYQQSPVAIIDLESTCFSKSDGDGHAHEVIEVGWVLCDLHTNEIKDKRSFFIKPSTSFVSYFCTELTGITPEQVKDAPSFKETMAQLSAWHQQHGVTLWLSQGNYDRAQLVRQCEAEGVAYPFDDQEWVNIKTIARYALGRKNRLGLNSLIDEFEIDAVGRQHSGADDAYNSAQVLLHLLEDPLDHTHAPTLDTPKG